MLDYEKLGSLAYALEYNPEGNRNVDDISEVLATFEGENEDRDWVWIVEFEDGERGIYIGGCDYTGWDCQSSLTLFPFTGDEWESIVRDNWSGGWTNGANLEDVIDALCSQFGL